MRIIAALAGAALLASFLPLHAQERQDSPYPVYRVEFNIGDSRDAAARGDRHYTLLVKGTTKSVLKVGNRVPVANGSSQPGGGNPAVSPLVNTQYSYIDIGVNIECLVREMAGRAALHGSIDLSNVMQTTGPAGGSQPNPTISQTKLELDATLDLGKPMVIASVDDPVTMRQLTVQATITKVN